MADRLPLLLVEPQQKPHHIKRLPARTHLSAQQLLLPCHSRMIGNCCTDINERRGGTTHSSSSS